MVDQVMEQANRVRFFVRDRWPEIAMIFALIYVPLWIAHRLGILEKLAG